MKKMLVVTGLVFGLVNAAQAQEKTKPAAGGTTAKPAAGAPAAQPMDKKAPAAGAAATGAAAGAPPSAADMAPPKAGTETEALKPFAKSATWTGKVPAGAWGPSSPEMTSKGKATCKWTLNNLWATCELEDTMGTGKQAMKWQAHWTFGWDFGAKEYRGVIADTWGMAGMMKGTLEGQKLTWESMHEVMMMGHPTKMRMTMDATDPKAMKFTGEHTVGGKWIVDEETTMKTTGGK